jgi:hypothetical protein
MDLLRLLTQNLPLARVFVYGYICDRWPRYSWGLLPSLVEERKGRENRPLMIVAHGTGFLLAQRAITDAKERWLPQFEAVVDGFWREVDAPGELTPDLFFQAIYGTIKEQRLFAFPAFQVPDDAPLRVLMMAPTPSDADTLQTKREFEEMKGKIRQSGRTRKWIIAKLFGSRISEVTHDLDSNDPHLLHIAGHGSKSLLWFEDAWGSEVTISKEALAKVLGDMLSLGLVIISACYSETQAQVIADAVGYAIGMEAPVDDVDAVNFTREFDYSYCNGRTIY